MSKADEAIITGMDCNPQWMYAQYKPIQNIGEGSKEKSIDSYNKKWYSYIMDFKLLSTEFTNEILLSILPFETGYLLRQPEEGVEYVPDVPCEKSVQFAMMLRSIEYTLNPHKIDPPWEN